MSARKRAEGGSRTRSRRVLSPPGQPIASLPHGAPPGARTLYSWIKSPVLHPYSSRRAERHAGVEPSYSRSTYVTYCATIRHAYPAESGQEESNLRSHAPKARALPLGYGQPVDRPGFEPGNLLLARELLYQLELAAQELPDLGRRAARAGLAGAGAPASEPASLSPFHPSLGCSQTPSPRSADEKGSSLGVPLWNCQRAGTFTPRGGAPHGRQESNPQPLVLETSALPS